MDKAQILALADRVEALTGPDRGVDAAIVLAICRGATVGHYAADDDGDIVFHAAAIGIRDKSTCPHFTASLDAAMTLVPEGMIARRYVAGRLVPHMWEVSRSPDNGGWIGNSDYSSANALTAASLRAMSGGEDGNV